MKYPNSLTALEDDLKKSPETEITSLAHEIITMAKEYDLEMAEHLKTYPDYIIDGKLIERNLEHPVEFTHNSVLGAPGADSISHPIEENEEWNKGRRATNTGAVYKLNERGLPINPYLKTGITGQGLLWQLGPNHAVDNGLLTIKPDEINLPTLYAIGINRKDSAAKTASFAGGFAKFKKTTQGYILDKETVAASQAEEFFEEMLSGSVELLPEYQNRITEEFNKEIAKRMQKRSTVLDEDKLEEIRGQVTVHLKMKQVEEYDNKFFNRLTNLFSSAKECYAGPVLNSARNTDNSWIETRLSWILLDDEKWKYIRGEKPKFDYQLSAGDDAAAVKYFKVDGELVKQASSSHKAMFAFMVASFMLDTQSKKQSLDKNILNQIKDFNRVLKTKPSHASSIASG